MSLAPSHSAEPATTSCSPNAPYLAASSTSPASATFGAAPTRGPLARDLPLMRTAPALRALRAWGRWGALPPEALRRMPQGGLAGAGHVWVCINVPRSRREQRTARAGAEQPLPSVADRSARQRAGLAGGRTLPAAQRP